MSETKVEPEAHRAGPLPWRHIGMLVIALVGLVVGAYLVLHGRSVSRVNNPSSSTTLVEQSLASLGQVATITEAKQLVRRLNLVTLPATDGLDSNVTEANVKRCDGAIQQQATDRTLGQRGVARQLRVGRIDALVVSYAMPASGKSPKGTRAVIADSKTCRVLAAVEG